MYMSCLLAVQAWCYHSREDCVQTSIGSEKWQSDCRSKDTEIDEGSCGRTVDRTERESYTCSDVLIRCKLNTERKRISESLSITISCFANYLNEGKLRHLWVKCATEFSVFSSVLAVENDHCTNFRTQGSVQKVWNTDTFFWGGGPLERGEIMQPFSSSCWA